MLDHPLGGLDVVDLHSPELPYACVPEQGVRLLEVARVVVEEDELLDLTPAPVFTVNKLSVGGIYDFYRAGRAKFGVGGLVSFYGLPSGLEDVYGDPTSAMVFARIKVE